MPQVDYGKLRKGKEQLKEYCEERGIKRSKKTAKAEYVGLAGPVLPGVDCWALSILELRGKCKAQNGQTPPPMQYKRRSAGT